MTALHFTSARGGPGPIATIPTLLRERIAAHRRALLKTTSLTVVPFPAWEG